MLHCLSDVNQGSLQLTEVESVSMEGYLKEFELFFFLSCIVGCISFQNQCKDLEIMPSRKW